MTLYVGNLKHYVDETALYNSFIQFGFISDLKIARDKVTGAHKGFGFVTYASSSSGAAAMHYMQRCRLSGPFQGMALKVSHAHRKKLRN